MTAQPPELLLDRGSHVVHLCDSDVELSEQVGALLVGAAAGGAVTIVIATDSRRRAFEAELERAGIGTSDAILDGTLVMLDAAATLAWFTRDGRLDPAAFDEVIGGLLRDAAQTGRPVWAYGEMVALLWDAGDVLGAIDLEELWNDLAREVPFALHCGYLSGSAPDPDRQPALQRVCGLHSTVITLDGATARLPARADSPRAARRMVRVALRRCGHPEQLLQSAELVASELATNAVIHTGSSFSVRVRPDGEAIRIEVQDSSDRLPRATNPGQKAASGRGLRLIEQLGARWGAQRAASGKTVWAEL